MDHPLLRAGVLLAVALLACSSLHPGAAAQDATVIVIGAGISGLAAARKLIEAQYDVLVLESRNRAGGRLLTQTIEGTPVDLGGAWIQGTEGNPLVPLAKQYNLATASTNRDETIFVPRLTATPLTEAQAAVGYGLYLTFRSYLQSARQSGSLKINTTVEQVLDAWYSTVKISDPEYYLVRLYLVTAVETEYAASISTLSAQWFDQDQGLDGGMELWKTGYSSLVAKLVQGVRITYGQVVTAIDYSEDNLVTITTEKGKKYTANYVISTIPLGVLKSPKAPKFNPPLPAKKRTAISTLGIGLLNKVILTFKTAFWTQVTGNSDWVSYVSTTPGDYQTFLSLSRSLKKPVLVCLVAGDFAWAQENRTDAQIQQAVTTRLRAMFPKTYQPPTSVVITRWGKEPWSWGSYPFIRAGAAKDAYTVMSEPVAGKLFFAGDSTSQNNPATAHGAYWSGEREAERIINIGEERRRRLAAAVSESVA